MKEEETKKFIEYMERHGVISEQADLMKWMNASLLAMGCAGSTSFYYLCRLAILGMLLEQYKVRPGSMPLIRFMSLLRGFKKLGHPDECVIYFIDPVKKYVNYLPVSLLNISNHVGECEVLMDMRRFGKGLWDAEALGTKGIEEVLRTACRRSS